MSINEQIAALAAELAESESNRLYIPGQPRFTTVEVLRHQYEPMLLALLNHPQVLIKLGILMGAYCEERGVGQASSGVIGGHDEGQGGRL